MGSESGGSGMPHIEMTGKERKLTERNEGAFSVFLP